MPESAQMDARSGASLRPIADSNWTGGGIGVRAGNSREIQRTAFLRDDWWAWKRRPAPRVQAQQEMRGDTALRLKEEEELVLLASIRLEKHASGAWIQELLEKATKRPQNVRALHDRLAELIARGFLIEVSGENRQGADRCPDRVSEAGNENQGGADGHHYRVSEKGKVALRQTSLARMPRFAPRQEDTDEEAVNGAPAPPREPSDPAIRRIENRQARLGLPARRRWWLPGHKLAKRMRNLKKGHW